MSAPSSCTRLIALLLLLVTAGVAAETPTEAIDRAKTLARTDKPAALRLLDATLATLTSPADQSLRLRAQARRCWLIGDGAPQAALDLADRALSGVDAAQADRWYAQVQLCRGWVLEQLERYDEAGRAYALGVDEARRLDDAELMSEALVHRGELHYFRGEFGDALADLKRSYDIAVQRGAVDDQRYVLNAIANLYGSAGEYERALAYYRQGLAAAQASGDARGAATAHTNLGITLDKQGRPEAALAEYETALALQRERQDADEIAGLQRSIGIVLTKLGRGAQALTILDAALAQFRASDDAEMVAETRLSRAVALRALGRAGEAVAEYDAIEPWFAQTQDRPFLEKLHSERALALADAGRWADAYAARNAQIGVQREIDGQLKREQTARLRIEFDTDKTEAENRDLQRENALRARALVDAAKIRELQTSVIGLALAVALVLGAFALRQRAYARQLRVLALTDELTHLPNRRHILARAAQRLEDARRRNRPLCLMSLDVDHFKRINDTLGHDAGDRVLERVARACEAAVARDGEVGRVGGEEFLILLPLDYRSAVAAGERVRAEIATIDTRDIAPELTVTASIGVAVAGPEDHDWSPVAKRADEAMYAAKARGRNRVVLAAA